MGDVTGNYCPILGVPIVAKVLEKIVTHFHISRSQPFSEGLL